jgi:hypothetical protein
MYAFVVGVVVNVVGVVSFHFGKDGIQGLVGN